MSALAACRVCRTPTADRHPTGAPLCLRCATPPAPGVVRAKTATGKIVEGASLDDIARQLAGPRGAWFRQTAFGAGPFAIYFPDGRCRDGERRITTLLWVQGL